MRLGDRFAAAKQWDKAAEAYALAWEADRRQPLPLFLRGWALTEAGAKLDGEPLMEHAHWLPLGDDGLRVAFARELGRRGFVDHARRERELALKVGQPNSFPAGEAHRLMGVAALERGDYLAAADGHERALSRVLRAHTNFVDVPANLTVPHYVHRLRARGFIATGKLDAAKADMAICEALLPASPELALQVVPELEKRGLKKEADDVFARALAGRKKLVGDYPDAPGLHNSLAWLCAGCRRELELAQGHAEKAVAAEPNAAGYRDTLAEVLFQRGKKDEAIAHMKQCVAREPGREYYRLQLRRFAAGDPSAPLPPE